MVGILRGIEGLFMTLPAIRIDQLVVPADMTFLAKRLRVSPLESELRCRVIERAGFPIEGRVAGRAVMRELGVHVIRKRCLIEILLMTLIAVRVDERVIVVDVASIAGEGNMRAGENKLRRVVIELRGLPLPRSMTLRTVMIEIARRVIRIQRLVEFVFVALETIRKDKMIVPICMALLAGCCRVRTA
jgi:hypothetical protein